MKQSKLTINAQAACELLIQEMDAAPPPQSELSELFQKINMLRLEKQWPMATSMSCFNPKITPSINTPPDLDLKTLRSFWQAGLTLVLKHNRHEGVAQMLACCRPLAEYPGESSLSQLSRVFLELLPLMGLLDVDLMISLAGRFDIFLRDADHLQAVPVENLQRDCLFYLSIKKPEDFDSPWIWNEQSERQLQNRLHWVAKQFSQLLYPAKDTDKIDKSTIEKNLIPITDALLFLGEIQLRTRMILRLEKIDERMLKIAVPIQLLMAEALRL